MKTTIFFVDYTNNLNCCQVHTKNKQVFDIKYNNFQNINATFNANSIQLSAFLNELNVSPIYRFRIIVGLKRNVGNNLVIKLIEPQYYYIDYQLNEISLRMIWEKIELDYLMSWLSTLGGGFSSLGDNIEKFATIAGKISREQMKLALLLKDPIAVSRSKLYFSIALIQKGKLKQAKKLILQQYQFIQSHKDPDIRIIKMCQGIWHNLRYAYQLKKEKKLSLQ